MSSEREPLDIEKALNLLKGSEKNFAFTCEQDIRLATPDYAKFSAAFTAFSIARLALDELKAARQDWHPVCTDHTCKGYRTRHEHASPTQVAGIGEHRIAKAARALITAVTFAGASDLPNDAGEGYMARVPMQFISDMEAALADLHISSKPIKDEDDALYHMIIDIITPLLPHEVYGNIESAAEAILPHLAPQEDVKVTTEQAHKELYAMIDEANVKALVEASDAVVKRWDSPKWKDLPHTADYIHALRNALTPFLHTTDDKQRGEK